MEALVTGGHAVRVVIIPIAANIVRRFEYVEGDAIILQPLGRGEAGTTGTDDANFRFNRCGHDLVAATAIWAANLALALIKVTFTSSD